MIAGALHVVGIIYCGAILGGVGFLGLGWLVEPYRTPLAEHRRRARDVRLARDRDVPSGLDTLDDWFADCPDSFDWVRAEREFAGGDPS